jgi:hypothetical protein
MSDNIIRFPVERTAKGKQEAAIKAFFDARREWRLAQEITEAKQPETKKP